MSDRRLRRTPLAFLIILIVGWLTAFGVTLQQMHDQAISDALAEAEKRARDIEQYVTQTLEMVDVLAIGLQPGQSTDSPSQVFASALGASLRQAPYLRSISLIGPNGSVLASSTPSNLDFAVSLQDFLPPPEPRSAILHIGSPWQGRDLNGSRIADDAQPVGLTAPYFVPLLRKLRGAEEPYWIVAAINPDHFVLHFQHLLPEEEGDVQLLRHDGVLLASTDPTEQPGQRGRAGDLLNTLSERDAGTLAQSLPDGTQVLSAYRASRRFPVTVAVHLKREHVHARWEARARELSLTVMPILAGLIVAMLLVNIRQRRLEQRERDLDKANRLAASMFGATTDAVLMTTPSGELIAVNPAFERITGYSAGEVLGQNPRCLSSGVHDRHFYQQLWESVCNQGYWQGEIINRRKDGKLFHGLLTITAVKDEIGKVTHYVGVTADISERKKYEADLLAAKERAEAALLAKTTFLATLSHELRTPMHGVLGMTDLLLRSPLNEKQQKQLGTLRGAAEALLKLLTELLDFSTIETRGVIIERGPFSPATLLTDLAALFGPHASQKGLLLRTDIAADLPPVVQGDVLHLRQILTNLLSNAIKFTARGEIRLHAGYDHASRTLVLSVQDTGIGIPPEKHQSIFEPFVQADGSASRAHGGAGLGLTISQRIADALGGSLTLVSQPGMGSTFTLTLHDVDLPSTSTTG